MFTNARAPACRASPVVVMSPSIEVRTTRGRHGSAASSRASVDPVSIGQLDVEQNRRGLQLDGGRQPGRDAVGLADDGQAAGGEQPSGELPELRVVVDHEN